MIYVLDLLDNVIGYIKKYSDLKVKPILDSWPEISFKVPSNENNNNLLQNEIRLRYNDEPYVIKDINPSRDNSGSPVIQVSASSIAVDLNHKPRQVVGTLIGSDIYPNWSAGKSYEVFDRIKYYGVIYECRTDHTSGSSLSGTQWLHWTTCNFQAELAEVVLNVTDMMELALADTGWSVGIVDDDGASRTFSGEWVSVPALLQEMAEKFNKHIVYHGTTKTIDMLDEPGQDNNITIEYGKNILDISKSADSTDFITKLYAYGDEELTFNDVNIHGSGEHLLDQLQDHQSFILDFSYFLAQGYSKDQIYASILAEGDGSPFIRLGKLDLSDYIDDIALLNEAKKQLTEELSKPIVSYKVSFIMLSDVLAGYNESIGLGDWITIRDLGLGVDVKVRLISMDITPGYPENSSAEFSSKNEFFGSAVASTIQYNKKLSNSKSLSDLMNNYINTFTTVINSSKGDLVWKDGQLTSIELDENGVPTGNQVRLTPGGLGVSTNFGVSYDNAITGAGVLAQKVIANSLHILSIGSDGIIIEPQSSGVRLNNTEGIVVQSEDLRFTTKMQASNEMSGSSYGFSIWNGDFTDITIIDSGGYFKVNNTTTAIPYTDDYYAEVRDELWYLFRKTSITDTTDGVMTGVGGILYIDGVSTGFPFLETTKIDRYQDYWYVGDSSGVITQYNGDALVFGVTMNGDAYFKGSVYATDGVFHGTIYATDGEFTGIVNASDLQINGVSILTDDYLIDSAFISGLINPISGVGMTKDLWTDTLTTSDKIRNYLVGNMNDVNYVFVQDQYLNFITEKVVLGERQETSTGIAIGQPHAGLPMYWIPANAETGVPSKTYVTTDITTEPVMVYVYETTQIKAGYGFDIDGNNEPTIRMGVGDGSGPNNAKGFIRKGITGLQLDYYSSYVGKLRQLILGDDGIKVSLAEYSGAANVRNIIVTTETPNTSMGKVNDIIFKI